MKEPRGWGYWTEIKLDALARYLPRFTTAARKAPTTIYLDLFAGGIDNFSRDRPEHHFPGSTIRAIDTVPTFSHLRFFELGSAALDLNRQLRHRYPTDQRWEVIAGDCNTTVGRVLADLRRANLHWSPTFAFVDPDGLDVDWATLAQIAAFKHPHSKSKAEMWILFSHYAIPRLDGYDRTFGAGLTERVTAFLGSDRWRRIADRRSNGALSAAEARSLHIDYFCHRCETVLGYSTTMTFDLGNESGTPIYTMVFATDHPAGVRIMESVLERARTDNVEYRAAQRALRERNKREQAGTPNLFDAAGEEMPIAFDIGVVQTHRTRDQLPPWLIAD